VDAADAKQARFPLQNVGIVKARVGAMLENLGATAVVCSAACGADLIALSEAEFRGLRRRVILPFERKLFRDTSVIDRPGDWSGLYDKLLDAAEAAGDLIVLQNRPGDEAYSACIRAILDDAIALGRTVHEPVTCVLIWNGVSRGNHDFTEEFSVEARRRGLAVAEVRTT
jgi:hypothetical protein